MPDTTEKRHHFNPDRTVTGHGITSVQTRQYFSLDKTGQIKLIQTRQKKGTTLIQTGQDKVLLQSRQSRAKNFNPDNAGQSSDSVQTWQNKKL
jgi:hypothetical protein